MASSEVINFANLAVAINEETPTGVELKEDDEHSGKYYAVKDARDAARNAERTIAQHLMAGDDASEIDIDPPNWQAVKEQADEIITWYSKDLWVCAWFIEALTRIDGFPGLRDGIRMTREICEQFWDDIHPRPDEEDGYAHTVAQFTGLNGDESDGALIAPINDIPITKEGSYPPLSSSDYIQAAELAQITDPEVKQQRIDQGAVTLEDFDRAVRETPEEFYLNLREDIEQTIEEWDKLHQVFGEKCTPNEYGDATEPPSSQVKDCLQACLDRLMSIARHVFDAEAAQAEADAEEGAGGELVAGGGGQVAAAGEAGPLRSREDAFKLLGKIADFFRRTEPHSVVSYSPS